MPDRGFLFAEDNAIKTRLRNVFVVDDKKPERKIDVFFGMPDDQKEKVYPYATINLLDIVHATYRQESERKYYYTNDQNIPAGVRGNYTSLNYYPSMHTEAELLALAGTEGFLSTEQFVPVDLLYQVTTFSRDPRHSRQLMGLMLRRVTPFRRGFIEIPEDGTIRRFDLLDYRIADILDQEAGYKKRVFRNIFTLSMSAEIPASDLIGSQTVFTVVGQLEDNNQVSDVLSLPFSEDF